MCTPIHVHACVCAPCTCPPERPPASTTSSLTCLPCYQLVPPNCVRAYIPNMCEGYLRQLCRPTRGFILHPTHARKCAHTCTHARARMHICTYARICVYQGLIGLCYDASRESDILLRAWVRACLWVRVRVRGCVGACARAYRGCDVLLHHPHLQNAQSTLIVCQTIRIGYLAVDPKPKFVQASVPVPQAVHVRANMGA